ncbi:MAG: hypothetical protein FJ100_07545 [Deltaproteobacteria bacterium]|nr:hypothetical protein [Deltaproteobacteria bacterium]
MPSGFTVEPLQFVAGEVVIVEAGVTFRLALRNFIGLPARIDTLEAMWDLGDGVLEPAASGNAPISVDHIWSPGRYTLGLQASLNGEVITLQWPLEAVASPSLFAATGVTQLAYLAAAQGTLDTGSHGVRHAIALLPRVSSVGSGSYYGNWGSENTNTLGLDDISAALDKAVLRWQSLYAHGFGRMPMPPEAIERAAYAHTENDVVAYGTNTTLSTYFNDLEQHVREAVENPNQGHRWQALFDDMTAIVDTFGSGTSLDQVQLVSANLLMSGDHSIRLGDVVRWYEYARRAVPNLTTFSSLTVEQLRILAGQYQSAVPEFCLTSAWCWEVAQAASQVVTGLLIALDESSRIDDAKILVLGNPQSGTVSLRFHVESMGLWVHIAAGPARSAKDRITWAQLAADGAPSAAGGATHVAGRAVAYATTDVSSTPTMRFPYDIERVRSVLDPNADRPWPSLAQSSITAPTPSTLTQDSGLTVCTQRMPDGAARARAQDSVSPTFGVFDVQRPAMKLPGLDEAYSAIRPHAAVFLARASASPCRQQGADRVRHFCDCFPEPQASSKFDDDRLVKL